MELYVVYSTRHQGKRTQRQIIVAILLRDLQQVGYQLASIDFYHMRLVTHQDAKGLLSHHQTAHFFNRIRKLNHFHIAFASNHTGQGQVAIIGLLHYSLERKGATATAEVELLLLHISFETDCSERVH